MKPVHSEYLIYSWQHDQRIIFSYVSLFTLFCSPEIQVISDIWLVHSEWMRHIFQIYLQQLGFWTGLCKKMTQMKAFFLTYTVKVFDMPPLVRKLGSEMLQGPGVNRAKVLAGLNSGSLNSWPCGPLPSALSVNAHCCISAHSVAVRFFLSLFA